MNEEQPILVYWWPNSFKHLLACQNEFDTQWTNIECFSVKHPLYLQACIKNLPFMEGVVFERTKSQPQVIVKGYPNWALGMTMESIVTWHAN